MLLELSLFVVIGLLIWCFTQALDGLLMAIGWLACAGDGDWQVV